MQNQNWWKRGHLGFGMYHLWAPYELVPSGWLLGRRSASNGYPKPSSNHEKPSKLYRKMQKIGEHYISLLERILTIDPNQRMTIDEVYSHSVF